MTKNEIVARWLGKNYWEIYFTDYNLLHEAWVKFRDLKFDDRQLQRTHTKMVTNLGNHIAWSSITEAFDELIKGIEWYESLKQTKS